MAEVVEDVPQACFAGSNEDVLVSGHLTPDLIPYCLGTPGCNCLEEQDCSMMVVPARDTVWVMVELGWEKEAALFLEELALLGHVHASQQLL